MQLSSWGNYSQKKEGIKVSLGIPVWSYLSLWDPKYWLSPELYENARRKKGWFVSSLLAFVSSGLVRVKWEWMVACWQHMKPVQQSGSKKVHLQTEARDWCICWTLPLLMWQCKSLRHCHCGPILIAAPKHLFVSLQQWTYCSSD